MASILKLDSPIWTYFSCNSDSFKGKRATCNVCKKSYSRAGSSTTPLVNHLRSVHKKAYEEYKLLSEERQQENKTVKPSSEMALAKFEMKKQITIQRAIDSNLQWDNSDAKSIELDKLIGEMISLDDLLFSHVEDLGFIGFVHKATPLNKLKTRKYYSEKILPDIYESVSKKVRHFLFDYIKLSFTTDIWTNDSAKVCLMSLTAHCIDENFRRKKFVLCATELKNATQENSLTKCFTKCSSGGAFLWKRFMWCCVMLVRM